MDARVKELSFFVWWFSFGAMEPNSIYPPPGKMILFVTPLIIWSFLGFASWDEMMRRTSA